MLPKIALRKGVDGDDMEHPSKLLGLAFGPRNSQPNSPYTLPGGYFNTQKDGVTFFKIRPKHGKPGGELHVGDEVLAKWPGNRGRKESWDNPWYAARVEGVLEDDTFTCYFEFLNATSDPGNPVRTSEIYYAPGRPIRCTESRTGRLGEQLRRGRSLPMVLREIGLE